jgi:hypothetical protein
LPAPAAAGGRLSGLRLLRHDLTNTHPLQLLDGRHEHVAHLWIVDVDRRIRVIDAKLAGDGSGAAPS